MIDFLQQGQDTDFSEKYNHSGKRVVAKALSEKKGPKFDLILKNNVQCVLINSQL